MSAAETRKRYRMMGVTMEEMLKNGGGDRLLQHHRHRTMGGFCFAPGEELGSGFK